MTFPVGVIFFDGEDVIIKIYELSGGQLRLIGDSFYNLLDLGMGELLEEAEAVKIIGEVKGANFGIGKWRLGARGIHPEIIKRVATATGDKIEYLTYEREQELICKGMILD